METVKAIIILGQDGKRILARFFDSQISAKTFDAKLFAKTKSQKAKNEDIVMLDSYLCLHRNVCETNIYVVGGRKENPLVLHKLLHCLSEVVSSLCTSKSQYEQQQIHEHMSQIILALDEVCDEGIILETDPDQILSKISQKEGAADSSMAAQVFQSATEHIKFAWMRS